MAVAVPMVGSGAVSRKQGRKRVGRIRLALVVAMVAYAQTQTVYGRPNVARGNGAGLAYSDGLQGSVQARNTQDDLRQLLDNFVEATTHPGHARSPGNAGVHPLPRSVVDSEDSKWKRQGLPLLETEDSPPPATAAAASPAQTLPVLQAASASPVQASAPASAASQAPTIIAASPSNTDSKASNTASASSKKTDKASSTSKPEQTSQSGVGAMFSPSNKLFPLAIAICVAVGLGALFIIIAIGKCYSHRQLAREERNGGGRYKAKNSSILTGDAFANTGVGRTRTLGKSLRRALTRGKLGGNSFARRNREGTVLIDVGDEVYAVTPEVAREYERERKSVLGSYHGSNESGSGASRLTFPANQPTPSRQALYNAQLIVAANQAEVARGKPQAPRGFDINSWRESSSLPGVMEDDERTLYGERASNASKDSLHKEYATNNVSVGRSLSKRLADGLRALTGSGADEDALGEPRTSNAFSFDSEKQHGFNNTIRQAQVPLSATVPVLTRGNGAWAIQRQEGGDQKDEPFNAFKKTGMAVKKTSSDSTLRDSALSHERVVLRDDSRPAPSQQARPSNVAATTNAASARPKSILKKHQQQQQQPVGGYRNRPAQSQPAQADPRRQSQPATGRVFEPKTSSTAQAAKASGKPLQGRPSQKAGKRMPISSTPAGAGTPAMSADRKPIVLKPEIPERGMVASKGQAAAVPSKANVKSGGSSSSGHSSASNDSRDLYRPLPLPPAMSPMAMGGTGKSGK